MTTAGFGGGGLAARANRYEAFFVSEGAMHDGAVPYPGAVEAMMRLKDTGRPVVVLTNDGQRAAANIARIDALGFSRHSFTTVMSSGEVIWHALRTGAFGPPFGAGRRFWAVGDTAGGEFLQDLDLRRVDHPEAAEFLVIAGPARTGRDEAVANLAPAAAQHVPALCADPDHLTPSAPGTLSPAALAALYEGLGGRVTHVGKPYRAMFAQAMKASESSAHRILFVADTLEDVRGGAEAGCDTALVRTGSLAGRSDAELEALTAAAPHPPGVVLPALRW